MSTSWQGAWQWATVVVYSRSEDCALWLNESGPDTLPRPSVVTRWCYWCRTRLLFLKGLPKALRGGEWKKGLFFLLFLLHIIGNYKNDVELVLSANCPVFLRLGSTHPSTRLFTAEQAFWKENILLCCQKEGDGNITCDMFCDIV